jgi:DNA polymerase III subunit delta
MTAISHQQADRYLLRPSSEHYLFLIFGPDQGRRSERCQTLLRSRLGVECVARPTIDLPGDEISSDPHLLLDEAHAVDMFNDGLRIIRVSVGNKSLLSALDLVARARPTDSVIILEAGDLRRDAPLRKWFDQQPFAASIECRPDDARDIQRLIDTEIDLAGLTIDPDARETLGTMLGEDRLSSRAALTKITLYAHGQATITGRHISEILQDESALSIDSIISALFSGRPNQVTEVIQKALQNGVDVNLIIAGALRYATALHRSRIEIDGGASFDDALQIILRQINGFNRKSEIASHLRNVDPKKALMIISALSGITKAMRKNNLLVDQRVTRFFLAAAASIKRN